MRSGSWFHRHNLTLEQILCITYFWIYKVDQEFVKHELSISNQTIVDWYNYCHEVCVSILEKASELIGGQGVVVEIDESKFGKRVKLCLWNQDPLRLETFLQHLLSLHF
jgi:hypothetical protein